MSSGVAIVVFVVGLVASIMVHEWGHFATARRFGMRADRFFLGFGPTIVSTRVGETEYGVKALPLGGFVRIKGMTPTDERLPGIPTALEARLHHGEDPVVALRDLLQERGAPRRLVDRIVERVERSLALPPEPGSEGVVVDHDVVQLVVEVIVSEVPSTRRVGDLHHRLLLGDEGRFFHDRPAWQRAVVLGAGSFLHFVQAIVLVFLGWLLVGPTVTVPVVQAFATELPDGTVVESAAEAAGLQVGDRLIAVGGLQSDDFQELREVIRDSPGQPVTVTVEREGVDERLTYTITPTAYTDRTTGEEVGLFGFFPATETQPMQADEAMYATFVGPGSFTDMLTGTLGALGSVFGPEGIGNMYREITGTQERSPDGGISLVGAANAAGQLTTEFGLLALFSLLASVNVFVGVFNALPLPPLDGGHLAVLGVESAVNARRRAKDEPADFSVDPQTVAAVAVPVIVFVATVSLALLWLDLTNPISLQ